MQAQRAISGGPNPLFSVSRYSVGGAAFGGGRVKPSPWGVEFASKAKPETDRGAAAPANVLSARLRGHWH